MTTPDPDQTLTADAINRHAFDRGEWSHTRWLGLNTLKYPTDLFVLQDLIWVNKPTLIIETGTLVGGATLFYAHVLDALGAGRIITVDIRRWPRPKHPRLSFLLGSSTDPEIVAHIRSQVRADDRVMVLLDSNHLKAHVLAELAAYAELVTPGQYLVVEDTHLNGHPNITPYEPDLGEGPWEAVAEFMEGNTEFEQDRSCERFVLTQNPGGYLRRRFPVTP